MFLRQILAIIHKDITAELRTKEMFSSMFVFALLAVIIFNFAFELRVVDALTIAPGVLWVSVVFAGMLGLNRSFVLEKDRGCLDGLLLAPMDRSAIYFGKMAGNFIFITVVEAMILPIFAALLNVNLIQPWILGVLLLGTLGFSGVGTLFSAMAVHTRAREVLLPVLLFPVVVPILIAAVKLTAGFLDGQALADMSNWMQLLVAFDIILIAVSYMTFDYVVEE
ncbi:MAG: cytochrome C biogenesis protein [Anaerolineaceae bacterium 4572_32.1]|nr:MAG: cytochrome C biogenesis protein [Anaerolineaceae bacterium 4572_32.1]